MGLRITLEIENPNEPPAVDVHSEWAQFALWLSRKHGYGNLAGHEIGLSPELVRALCDWGDRADAVFPADDPASFELSDDFLQEGYELARRVRAELPAEWVLTALEPRVEVNRCACLRRLTRMSIGPALASHAWRTCAGRDLARRAGGRVWVGTEARKAYARVIGTALY